MYILLLTAYILSNVKALSLLQMIGILPYTQKVTWSPHTGLNDFSLVVFLESFFVEPLDLPFLMGTISDNITSVLGIRIIYLSYCIFFQFYSCSNLTTVNCLLMDKESWLLWKVDSHGKSIDEESWQGKLIHDKSWISFSINNYYPLNVYLTISQISAPLQFYGNYDGWPQFWYCNLCKDLPLVTPMYFFIKYNIARVEKTSPVLRKHHPCWENITFIEKTSPVLRKHHPCWENIWENINVSRKHHQYWENINHNEKTSPC